jgi:hypothetical protein
VLLEAQRRVLESHVQFINSEVEYRIAIRNVHLEQGSIMNYHGILMAEGESQPGAYASANRRNRSRVSTMNYVIHDPTIARPEHVPDDLVGHIKSSSIVMPMN